MPLFKFIGSNAEASAAKQYIERASKARLDAWMLDRKKPKITNGEIAAMLQAEGRRRFFALPSESLGRLGAGEPTDHDNITSFPFFEKAKKLVGVQQGGGQRGRGREKGGGGLPGADRLSPVLPNSLHSTPFPQLAKGPDAEVDFSRSMARAKADAAALKHLPAVNKLANALAQAPTASLLDSLPDPPPSPDAGKDKPPASAGAGPSVAATQPRRLALLSGPGLPLDCAAYGLGAPSPTQQQAAAAEDGAPVFGPLGTQVRYCWAQFLANPAVIANRR